MNLKIIDFIEAFKVSLQADRAYLCLLGSLKKLRAFLEYFRDYYKKNSSFS